MRCAAMGSSTSCSTARPARARTCGARSEEHTSELQSHLNLVCRLLLEKKKKTGYLRNGREIMAIAHTGAGRTPIGYRPLYNCRRGRNGACDCTQSRTTGPDGRLLCAAT